MAGSNAPLVIERTKTMNVTSDQQPRRTGENPSPAKFDLLRLDARPPMRTRARLGTSALAALLLAVGAWTAWDQDTSASAASRGAGANAATTGGGAAVSPVHQPPVRSTGGGPCTSPLSMSGTTGIGDPDAATVAELRSCLRHLRTIEGAAQQALAERLGTLVHSPVRQQPARNACQGAPATADTAQQWITSGHLPDCAR